MLRKLATSQRSFLCVDGDDIKGKELWELCQRFRGYLVSVYNRNPADKTACGVFAEHTAEDTIYVRLAASLSYLHEEAVFHLASHKLMHPEHLLVSGNVINNRDIVGLHESRGVFELGSVWNEVRYEEGSLLEEMGLDRALARSELPSPPFMFPKGRDIPAPYAYLQHVYFLRALRQRNSASLDKYRFGRMDFESAGIDAWTPDVVAYAGWDVVSDFSRRDCDQFPTYVEAHPDQPRSGISRLDHYLTSPRGFGLRSGRSSVAVGEALAVVLITHTQHMVFRRQQPFEPFDLQPRQTIGYEMDGTTAMDPFFDAAMWILGDQIQVGDDDTIENAVSKQAIPDPVGDDGVRLPIVSEADANPAHLSARDMVGYVGGDPELLASQEPPRDPNFDGERLEKAREHVAAGGRFGVQCEPGTEGVASLQGRFSQFGCYGWLEDRVMGRFQMLSDRLYQQVDGVYEPPPQ